MLSDRTIARLHLLQSRMSLMALNGFNPAITKKVNDCYFEVGKKSLERTDYGSPTCNRLFHLMEYSFSKPEQRVQNFYATQAWSLAHFLHHSDNRGQQNSFKEKLRKLHGGHYSLHSSTKNIKMEVERVLDRPGMIDYDNLKEEFLQKSLEVIGAGWVWLVRMWDKEGVVRSPPYRIAVIKYQGAHPPIITPDNQRLPCTPLLGVNLWEHAYFADYGLDLCGYLEAWWASILWERILPMLAIAASSTKTPPSNLDEGNFHFIHKYI